MLGFYNYTVILTYIGMLIGVFGMTRTMQGDLHGALFCLMLAGFCDMFDGKIASTKIRTQAEKRFGIQIDSLSDLLCFGALPALIVHSIAPQNMLALFVAGMYVLCALIRLAWFNVDEEERQNHSVLPREYYLGLPVTTIALFLPALLGLGQLCHWPLLNIGTVILAMAGVAFLTPFRLKKPQLPGKIGMLLCGCGEVVILLMGANSL